MNMAETSRFPIALLVLALVGSIAAGSGFAEEETEPTEMTMQMIFDFADGAEPWPSIDDVVMGGVSRSEMVLADGTAVFQGRLSLENNGGFASIRSRAGEHDLDGFDGLLVHVRGDGRTYGFRLRTTASFDGVSYQAELPTERDARTEVRLPFSSFIPVYRGRRVDDHPALDPAEIKTFGIILADKNPGPFRLEIDSIAAYRD